MMNNKKKSHSGHKTENKNCNQETNQPNGLESGSNFNSALLCGTTLALFILLTYFITIFGFWIHISLIHYSFVISLFIVLVLLGYKLRENLQKLLIIVCIVIGILIIPPTITTQYMDFGWDSNVFHELMIISLSNGQNPIFNNDIAYLNQTTEYSSQIKPYLQDISEWVRMKFIREANGYHILAASIFALTGDLQSSKAITIIGLIMSIFLFYSLLRSIFGSTNRNVIALLSCVAGVNSVLICTSLMFYVDGFLFSSLLTLMSLFGLYFVQKKQELLYIGLGYSLLFINIKSTAIIFFILLSIVLLIFTFKYEKKLIQKNVFLLIPFIILGFFCCYHPFIHNFFESGDVSGGSIQEAENFNDIPQSWKNLSTPHKFLLSLFSKAEVSPVDLRESSLKIPLLDISDSIMYSLDPPKIGGWGPLFSGIFILSFIFFLFEVYQYYKIKKLQEGSILLMYYLFMLVATIFVFQLSWYGRYVPQIALIPIFMIFPYVRTQNKYENLCRLGIIFIIIFNIILVSQVHYSTQQTATDIQNDIFRTVKNEMNNTVYIQYEGQTNSSTFMYSYIYELMKHQINFEINPQEIKNPIQFPTIIEKDFFIYGSAPDSYR